MIRKTAVVFGASGDIGKEISEEFARNGYNLGLTYYENEIEEFAEGLKNKYQVDLLVRKVDVRKSEEIATAINDFKKEFGAIDAGVVAFGVADKQGLLIDKNDEQILRVVETNLIGAIYTNKELCKAMLPQKRGVIVNISSIIGVDGASCESVYASSKAGLIVLTKSLSKEFGGFGIRVNAVSPGFIDTKMCACFDEEGRQTIKDNTVLSRLGKTSDISKVVYFLCTDNASFITGENIVVSGGLKV